MDVEIFYAYLNPDNFIMCDVMSFLQVAAIQRLLDQFPVSDHPALKFFIHKFFGVAGDPQEDVDLHRGYHYRVLALSDSYLPAVADRIRNMGGKFWNALLPFERLHLYTSDFDFADVDVNLFKRIVNRSLLRSTFPILTKYRCYHPYDFRTEQEWFISVFSKDVDFLIDHKLIRFIPSPPVDDFILAQELMHNALPELTFSQRDQLIHIFGYGKWLNAFRRVCLRRWLKLTYTQINVNWELDCN